MPSPNDAVAGLVSVILRLLPIECDPSDVLGSHVRGTTILPTVTLLSVRQSAVGDIRNVVRASSASDGCD